VPQEPPENPAGSHGQGEIIRPPTMADIAKDLGVSRQLVSLVLRDLPGASAATRERVREAAHRLGYSPHLGAQVLRRNVSKQLGVVFAPAHATETDIVQAIYPAAAEHGYQVVLSATTSTRNSMRALEELLAYRCDALIVIGSDLGPAELRSLARRATVPLVAVGAGQRNRSYDVVRSAGDEGIASCVRHLVELGHVAITYVHAASMPPAAIRLAGYLRTAEELSLKPDVIELTGDYTEECGAEAARRLLAAGSLPTAVVMGNDQAAVGLLLTLTRAGVPVPEELSVTGFDDSHFARLTAVDLTTVRQDPDQMGRRAVEAALRRIRHPVARPAEVITPTALVVRSSTATSPR
jgi:DNA-binding LacI/PurR family transcriptional regulator